MEPEIRNIFFNQWLVPVYVGVFILLATARTLYARRFSEWLQLVVTDKYFAMEGKGRTLFHPFNLMLLTVQILVFSLLGYQFLYLGTPQNPRDVVPFIQIVTGFGIFISFKFYLEKLIAHVLNFEPLMDAYLYEKASYLNLVGLLLAAILPFLSFSWEADTTLYMILFVILLLLYLLIIFSSVKRHQDQIFKHFFYFILYLCALEMAPLVILYQVFFYQG